MTLNHLCEGDVLLGCLNASSESVTGLRIWNDENASTVDSYDSIALITEAVNLNLSGFANLDR